MMEERHLMVLLCALCTCLNYADRVNISVTIIPLSETYNLSLSQQSKILSIFFLGYLPMQLLGALLCRRYGGKRVLLHAAFWWSLFTLLTPIAASLGVPCLLCCRVLLGISEGVAFPGVYHFLSSWVPPSERARSVGLFLTGVHVGSFLALVFAPLIIKVWSWQGVFYIFGLAGMAWIAAWHRLARDGEAETGKDAGAGATWAFTPFERRVIKTVLTDRRCVGVLLTQTLFSGIHFIILFWLPTYFKHVYSISTESLSFTSLPYIAMSIFAGLGGVLSDSLLRTGMTTTRARKIVTLLADSLAAILILAFTQSESVPLAVGLISMAMGAMSLNSGGFECNYMDMATPGAAGMFKAVCNTGSSGAGFLAIPLATWALETLGSWRAAFAALAVSFCAKMGVYCALASSDRVLGEDIDDVR